jgi:hypothetical protein
MAERKESKARTQAPAPEAGLCSSCAHQQVVRNTRGSSFSLCGRSRTEPSYPRYPRLPVSACPGYERRTAPVDGR